MTYCVLGDVQALITGFTITTTSTVTSAQVTTDIIPAIDRYIDDRLGKFYVTPVTGANSLLTLNRISRYLAAAEVAERVYIGQGPSESSQSTTWRQLAESDLNRLSNGDIILTDAVPTGDTPEPLSQQISDNLSSPLNTQGPLFCIGKQF